MTEEDWLECTNPHEMLDFLEKRATVRKLRLLAVACCRRLWPLVTDKRSRDAVEVIERFADGEADKKEREAARAQADMAVRGAGGQIEAQLGMAAFWTTHSKPEVAARETLGAVVGLKAALARDANVETAADTSGVSPWTAASMAELKEQAALVREIFGNPFHPLPPQKGIRLWKEGLDDRLSSPILDLARTIYEKRTFDQMPSLANALIDTGCDIEAVIRHCRSEGPHILGCWALDLLLEK